MKTIDIHSHFFPRQIPDLEERFGGVWPSIRHTDPGQAVILLGGREFRQIQSPCWDASKRIEELDRHHIDVQILCATPVLFAYDKPPEQALECARIFNDAAMDICRHDPERLKALCQVPLQDTDLACGELERALASGHIGVQIGNHVGNRNLDDEGILTFLHHCATLGAPVFVHPWDMMEPQRMNQYMLSWLVGMPAETHLTMLSLILSGAMERLPQSLSICFAHGGGSFAYLLGRADNAWHHRDIVREHCPLPPSSYVNRLHVDAAVFSADALALLVGTMGNENVMLGTDYPFPLGERRLGALIRDHAGFDHTVKQKILGGNASRFFRL